MSGSTSASDKKKSAAVTTTAAATQVPPAFSIDGLLGLKQQEATTKKEIEGSSNANSAEQLQDIARSTSSSVATVQQSGQPSAVAQASTGATHLVYSAAAAASSMVPSPALHGALWSSHPAASLAAFRCKYNIMYTLYNMCMHATYMYIDMDMHACTCSMHIRKNQHLLHFSLYLSSYK